MDNSAFGGRSSAASVVSHVGSRLIDEGAGARGGLWQLLINGLNVFRCDVANCCGSSITKLLALRRRPDGYPGSRYGEKLEKGGSGTRSRLGADQRCGNSSGASGQRNERRLGTMGGIERKDGRGSVFSSRC